MLQIVGSISYIIRIYIETDLEPASIPTIQIFGSSLRVRFVSLESHINGTSPLGCKNSDPSIAEYLLLIFIQINKKLGGR